MVRMFTNKCNEMYIKAKIKKKNVNKKIKILKQIPFIYKNGYLSVFQ